MNTKQLFLCSFFILSIFSCENKPQNTENNLKNNISIENLQDSIQKMAILLDNYKFFDIKSNEDALYFFQQNGIENPENFVIDQLLATNVTKDEHHPLIDYRPRRNAKFQINNIKLLNHRWIICNFSDGLDWGELLIRFDLNDDNTLSFKTFDQTLYVSEQKP